MKGIITVVGGDKVGIIAKVSTYLASHKINIVDITQTILSGNFVMMMMVEFDSADIDIDAARKDLTKEAETLGIEVNVMNEKVFTEMHRIYKNYAGIRTKSMSASHDPKHGKILCVFQVILSVNPQKNCFIVTPLA